MVPAPTQVLEEPVSTIRWSVECVRNASCKIGARHTSCSGNADIDRSGVDDGLVFDTNIADIRNVDSSFSRAGVRATGRMQLLRPCPVAREKRVAACDVHVLGEWDVYEVVADRHDRRGGNGEGDGDRSEETSGREHLGAVACCEVGSNTAQLDTSIKQRNKAINGEN